MKLIIECAEQTYSECKKISGLSETAYVIAHGIPYNPSGDYISRSDLKEEISKMPNANPSYWNKCDVVDREDVLDEIDSAQGIDLGQMRQEATENALKKAREEDRWISVNERLPEEKINPNTNDFAEVLCSTIWGAVRAYKFGSPFGHDKPHFWLVGAIMDEYVTHWRYLPEPYESEKGGAV